MGNSTVTIFKKDDQPQSQIFIGNLLCASLQTHWEYNNKNRLVLFCEAYIALRINEEISNSK